MNYEVVVSNDSLFEHDWKSEDTPFCFFGELSKEECLQLIELSMQRGLSIMIQKSEGLELN